MQKILIILFWSLSALAAPLVFDFEDATADGWMLAEGDPKFPLWSTRTAEYNRPEIAFLKHGQGFLSSLDRGGSKSDPYTCVADSPLFVLEGPEIRFILCGGNLPQAYLALCTEDGTELCQARGESTEQMREVTWNLPQHVGKRLFFRMVDHESGGWGHVNLDYIRFTGQLDPEATRKHAAGLLQSRAKAQWAREIDLPKLQAVAGYLEKRFPQECPGLANQVAEIAAKAADLDKTLAADPGFADRAGAFRRQILLANPRLRQPIVFVVRNPYYPSNFHAIETIAHTDEFNTRNFAGHGPGALKLLDVATGTVKTLLATPGVIRDPEISFDAKRIIFSMRRQVDEDYHIWEINADGTGLRQLTSAKGVCDTDPLYLPDNGIVFTSTRDIKYNQCSRDRAANLFRMEADGANIHQIDSNNLVDNQASLLPDGRILYSRWEYVDRNFGDAHAFWACNPDGTNHTIYWGNNQASPAGVYSPRHVPGDLTLCIFAGHHDLMWGALALVDRRKGINGPQAVLQIWPAGAAGMIHEGGGFDCDRFVSLPVKYADPWPLDDTTFLCSRMTGDGNKTGIYLIDRFGNELLLHQEGGGCYDPMPLAPRPRPPVIPTRRAYGNQPGTFYIQDVYEGTHMQRIARGMVKSLRIVAAPPKRSWSNGCWYAQGYTAPGMNWHELENKRILGTVPVEADGSAYFEAPTETFLYFQLLDQNGMMIQSMRSGTFVQPGETVGCIGCHDDRLSTPTKRQATAIRRAPDPIREWRGPARDFGFMAEVQPVFDKNCLACHDYGKKGADKLLLAGDRDLTFGTSYVELSRRGLTGGIGAGPAQIQQPFAGGSHNSKLIKTLQAGHHEVKLTAADLDQLIVWCDLNAPYYASYACAWPESLTGRCPLTNDQLARLAALTGAPLLNNGYTNYPGPQVSFDRPELSPCLARIQDKASPAWQEALAIIKAGQQALAATPEADRPGFIPCPTDARRMQNSLNRQKIEADVRQAIRTGQKRYDQPKEARQP
jgi:hypothetical protein